jgi:hypothetical protein
MQALADPIALGMTDLGFAVFNALQTQVQLILVIFGGSVRMVPSYATRASKAFNRLEKISKSCRCQTQRTPAAEMNTPFFRSSLLAIILP